MTNLFEKFGTGAYGVLDGWLVSSDGRALAARRTLAPQLGPLIARLGAPLSEKRRADVAGFLSANLSVGRAINVRDIVAPCLECGGAETAPCKECMATGRRYHKCTECDDEHEGACSECQDGRDACVCCDRDVRRAGDAEGLVGFDLTLVRHVLRAVGADGDVLFALTPAGEWPCRGALRFWGEGWRVVVMPMDFAPERAKAAPWDGGVA